MKRQTYTVEIIIKGQKFSDDDVDLILKLWKLKMKKLIFNNGDLSIKIARIKRIRNPKTDNSLTSDPWRKTGDPSVISQSPFNK